VGELPDDLLDRSEEEGARRVVLALIADAEAAAKRLANPADIEALHDFRVALRRTRAVVRSLASLLPKQVSRKMRRRLTNLQRATGPIRDAEVAIAWLVQIRPESPPEVQRGIDYLIQTFDEERRSGITAEEVERHFSKDKVKLTKRVARMRVAVDLLDRRVIVTTFGQALDEAVRRALDDLSELLTRVAGPQEAKRMHRARIAGKRLRYLLEPIRHLEPAAEAVLARMKGLQDLLGEINDAHVLAASILEARGDTGDFMIRTALDSVRARCIARTFELYRQLEADWIHQGLFRLAGEVGALSRALLLHKDDVEVERKYLLSRMPEMPAGVEVVEIDQGYVPGQRMHERVRRVRREGSIQYYRTVKLGKGVQRFELEEETTREVFEGLWKLAEGRRVEKRRFIVAEGDVTWVVDQFLDRELVLAEAELQSADQKPAYPAWLAPVVVEEVTDRLEYTNLSLAR
jgi:CHAD domain-containing protein/CYTH domain-containing protein